MICITPSSHNRLNEREMRVTLEGTWRVVLPKRFSTAPLSEFIHVPSQHRIRRFLKGCFLGVAGPEAEDPLDELLLLLVDSTMLGGLLCDCADLLLSDLSSDRAGKWIPTRG